MGKEHVNEISSDIHEYFEISQEVTEIRLMEIHSLQNLTAPPYNPLSPNYPSMEYNSHSSPTAHHLQKCMQCL